MRLTFSKWAFSFINNTNDILIELIIILDWVEKNLKSKHEMDDMPNDASSNENNLTN